MLWKPYPYPDENIKTYLSRVFAENNYSISYVREILGISKDIYNFPYDDQVEIIRRAFLLEGKYLKRHFDFAKTTSLINNNNFLSNIAFLKRTTKICPECLSERSYFREVWSFIGYTTCHIHNCLLISNCDKCGVEIPSLSRIPSKCKCGQEFKQMKVIASRHDHNHFFYISLYGLNLNKDKKNYLYSLPFDAAIELMLKLANLLNSFYCNKPDRVFFQISIKDPVTLSRLLGEVYEAFHDWPGGMLNLIKRINNSLFNEQIIRVLNEFNRNPYKEFSFEIQSYINERGVLGTKVTEQYHNDLEEMLLKAINYK